MYFSHKFYLIICLSLIWALMACQRQEIELAEPSHRVVFTSEMDFGNRIEVGNTLTFGDVSPGVVSRTWTFPSGGIDILETDDDATSTDATVRATFSQVGQFNVRLEQTFSGDAFVGTSQQGMTLDTTIVVTVLDSISLEIRAHYVNKDGTTGAELVLTDGALNEVPASNLIRYSFVTTGEPLNYLWTFDGGSPGIVEGFQEEIDVKYRRLGTYDLNFTASRRRPFGGDTITLTDFIKVVPSTDPVTLDQLTARDGHIAMVFSRDMDPASLASGDFEVSIENRGNIIIPTIANLSVDQAEPNIVLMELANESIYHDDVIKVSYTPGILQTADGVKATAFVEEELTFEQVNVLKDSDYDYSFENSTSANWGYVGWGAPWDMFDWSISSDQAFHGNNSALINMQASGGMIVHHLDANGEKVTFPVKKDQDYELGVWVYVVSLGATPAPPALQPDLRLYWEPDTDWGIGGNPTFDETFPVGEWVYSSAYVKFAQTGQTSILIRGFNVPNPEEFRMYIDNFVLAEVTLRPR